MAMIAGGSYQRSYSLPTDMIYETNKIIEKDSLGITLNRVMKEALTLWLIVNKAKSDVVTVKKTEVSGKVEWISDK